MPKNQELSSVFIDFSVPPSLEPNVFLENFGDIVLWVIKLTSRKVIDSK